MAFDPEAVAEFGVWGYVVGFGFAGVGYDAVVVWRGGGPVSVLKLTGEEIYYVGLVDGLCLGAWLGTGRTIPGFVAVVFGGGVAFEAVVEFVGCS